MSKQVNPIAIALIQQWMNINMKNKLCSICGSDKLLVLNDLVEMQYSPPHPSLKYIFIQIMCHTCGHTLLINQAKIFPNLQPVKEKDELPDKELEKYK